mmetsp:Transcript_36293/g.55758  ORF Transcript_36293/g.55758 Transcript_36293/m.55758 type:complete len:629 (+) Transcript_36293:14-1900(+)
MRKRIITPTKQQGMLKQEKELREEADPAEDDDPENFPSTYGLNKHKRKSICPTSYTMRKRLNVFAVVSVFVFAGYIASYGVESLGGAGTFLGKQQSVRPDPAIALQATKGMTSMVAAGRRLAVTTWNIAAINNNPFEYWMTVEGNPNYEKVMIDVENFLEDPGDKDVLVSSIFTEEMFSQLDKRITETAGWKSVKSFWDSDFKDRKIISGFMKDHALGSKRLASMPDRVTNTINVHGKPEPVCRPTVINMYSGDLSSQQVWWGAWESFMFDESVAIKKGSEVKNMIPYQMLSEIKKSKYPAITEEEEAVSLPLQTMCGAIFDAILVHMMNTVSEPTVWQPLRKSLVEALNTKKTSQTLSILDTSYGDSDIITLQEVSGALVQVAQAGPLGKKFFVVTPDSMSATRDQNSVILLNKKTFPSGPTKEISELVKGAFPDGVKVPVAAGDILAITTETLDGIPMVIASFHGDTDGLATKPVLDALTKVMNSDEKLVRHRLVFGLDANTYENPKPGKQQEVLDFGKCYVSHGLTSCWGDVPNPQNYTTFNARTYLQPQLNKACKSTNKRKCGDVNPKDFILFPKKDFEVVETWKDNTGVKSYMEDTPFPTIEFPSDHGILATILKPLDPSTSS